MDRMDDYFSIRLRFNLRDDTNYCGPLALMLATGERDIDEVNKRLDRQFCKGVPGQKLLSACRGYGYKYSLVKGIDRGYVVNVVKNARKSGVDLGTGLYLVFSTSHVSVLEDGQLIDWTGIRGRQNKRVFAVYKLEKLKDVA